MEARSSSNFSDLIGDPKSEESNLPHVEGDGNDGNGSP
jgi:hypothetical protein